MIYVIRGFQPVDAPHWETAFIEADDEASARAILFEELQRGRIETAWGWPIDIGEKLEGYHDPATWVVNPISHPMNFILGGGCR